ncbi:uncharacterized protein ASCRUDRAFT_71237 [Ascoidea rubescens DSM 1968]|uniref:Uncharacterized protein n=1 Tax=Ascoidea rubescens DSM 1968 TaxID=1344418 RepID=A0A1D2VF24_9ASCO|nr:hypothetical protein ASCRUDRAFT_71237 [Ascoidea rubescens DSM 1968]ODV60209.1 hypothetical protein ASCRUDRAFT_71237 [Ascoidea rubescens DSM 1968]
MNEINNIRKDEAATIIDFIRLEPKVKANRNVFLNAPILSSITTSDTDAVANIPLFLLFPNPQQIINSNTITNEENPQVPPTDLETPINVLNPIVVSASQSSSVVSFTTLLSSTY